METELKRLCRDNNVLRLRLEKLWSLYAELAHIAGEDVTEERQRVMSALGRES